MRKFLVIKRTMGNKLSLFIKSQRETIVYLIVGFIVTCVNWLIYGLLSSVFYVDIIISNIIAWIVAVVVAFVLNKRFVFLSMSWEKSVVLKEAISFVSSRVFTGIIEICTVPLLLYFGLNQPLVRIEAGWAKAIACLIGIILNYIFSKLFVFKGEC